MEKLTVLGDSQNSSKPFRPDVDRSKRCLNLVYLRRKNLDGGGGDMVSKF
jgi:hypothetical protein